MSTADRRERTGHERTGYQHNQRRRANGSRRAGAVAGV